MEIDLKLHARFDPHVNLGGWPQDQGGVVNVYANDHPILSIQVFEDPHAGPEAVEELVLAALSEFMAQVTTNIPGAN